MGNLAEHLMELAADWNAAFLIAEQDINETHRSAVNVFFEWPNGEIIETEVYSWVGGSIFQHSKLFPDNSTGNDIEPGYLSVHGAIKGWLQTYEFVGKFEHQWHIYQMCRDSYFAHQWKGLSQAISYFSQMVDDDPALLELLSDD